MKNEAKQHVLTRGVRLSPTTLVDGKELSNALTYLCSGLTVQEVKRTGTRKRTQRVLVTLDSKSWAWVDLEDLAEV
jgi:hypothetical protein